MGQFTDRDWRVLTILGIMRCVDATLDILCMSLPIIITIIGEWLNRLYFMTILNVLQLMVRR